MTQSEYWQTVRCPHCGAFIGQHCIPTGALLVGGVLMTQAEGQCATCLQVFSWDAGESMKRNSKHKRGLRNG